MEATKRSASSSKHFMLFFSLALFISPSFAIKKSYIVYMGAHSHSHDASSIDYDRVTDSHHSFLGSHLGSTEKAREAIFYSYTHHINGFAAILDESEADELSKHPDVVSVFLNKKIKLHTTRSWEFMELEHDGIIPESSIWKKARYGEDTIIGSLDTGVWPESASFQDNGYGPIPANWKGVCQSDEDPTFHCNRKLIGARYFNKGHTSDQNGPDNSSYYNSPRDVQGHGTHTLSTVAGNFVVGVDMLGVASGTAKGGSPKARVAAYRVCYGDCYESDVLAGFDMAIHDGVDVISASFGGPNINYLRDTTAIGSFHAMKHGITVVCSAGNDGPAASTVANVAPWQITVGASTMDRMFPSYLVLGNNRTFKGKSLNQAKMKNKYYPIVSSKSVKAANASELHANLCMAGSLDPKKVKGKILVCLRGKTARLDKSYQSSLAGAVGMILANDQASGNEVYPDPHYLPTSHISYSDGLEVYAYISSTEYPVAYLNPTTEMHAKPAPSMASFSAKGPNPITPEILKPDITAPGVNVLAAFSQEAAPTITHIFVDKRRFLYNILFGTSMACPHVSGVVGLLKTMHPEWSPSAIKSAIMTSARSRNNVGKPITDSANAEASPFSYGAGHIRPNRAMDPGLVYDLTYNDYLSFLCSKGYKETQIRLFSESSFKCPEPMISLLDLNYPSITVPNLRGSITVSRTLKNVGKPGTYHARFVSPPGFRVEVYPKTLEFESFGEEKTFKVTINATRKDAGKGYVFGRLRWSDGKHFVRSPIVVKGIAES